jgi:hypothetical protein
MTEHVAGCPFTPAVLRNRLSWQDRVGLLFSEGKPEECWEWTGGFYSNGYGHFYHNYQHIMAHHAVYELYKGCVPVGLELDHSCYNPKCVNPNHLEPVTHEVNVQRAVAVGRGAGAFQAAKTHCPKGHEYTEENTYRHKSGKRERHCKICVLARQKAKRVAKHAEKEQHEHIG